MKRRRLKEEIKVLEAIRDNRTNGRIDNKSEFDLKVVDDLYKKKSFTTSSIGSGGEHAVYGGSLKSIKITESGLHRLNYLYSMVARPSITSTWLHYVAAVSAIVAAVFSVLSYFNGAG